MVSKTIIERKTPTGEVERYVWLDGALIRYEEYQQLLVSRFPPDRIVVIDLELWGRESLAPSME